MQQTIAYTYGDSNWKDKLTAYNGTTISYDAIGNPTSDGTWTYTWTNGRQLASMSKSGTSASYTYNENGLRVQKNVNGTITNYVLHGKSVVHLTQGSNNLHFFYGADGSPAIVEFNGVSYGYVKNLQGDIIAIVNAGGTKVVEYAYDAWGRALSRSGSMASTLGTLNPFRYRGYVYDEETGLYYLRSRYYNSTWGKFVNADALNDNGSSLLNHNKFTYCCNMPVVSTDPSGHSHLFAVICFEGGGKDTSNDFATYALPLLQGPFLQKDRKGQAKLDRISRSYLVSSLDEIIRSNNWKYHVGSMSWESVDCVGITRIIVQQQSQTLCCSLPTTADDMRKLCGLDNQNMNQIVEGITLVPGMAVFTYDPTHKNRQGKIVPWYHMGVYVGNYIHPITGEYIADAVIQAANTNSGITVSSLSETSFTNYAFMPFINYN